MSSLLLEIGTEEIPAGYIVPALEALSAILKQKLTAARITHGEVMTYGTPRRLTAMVRDVARRQASVTEQVLGPPERIAFDAQKRPTVAALKFAEKVGVTPEKLRTTETDKGRYLCASLTHKGVASQTALKTILPEVILAIPFPKSMRWGDLSISFARPIQSVLAVYDKAVVSFVLGGRIKSGRRTMGHMFMQRKPITIREPDDYLESLRAAHVVADIAERRKLVEQEIARAAKDMGGRILEDAGLLDIVTNLVEIPHAVGGRFDETFLELPREILITSMRTHQKYFAVVDDQDRLAPCFVAVNNTRAKDAALVASGHARVLRARLSDAQFFFRADIKHRMDDWHEQLKGVLFQAQLGSVHAKVERVGQLGAWLARAGWSDKEGQVTRAAQLCKADLVSQVVYEFPDLQGTMGRIYAARAGEDPEVCAAIEEHYRPTYSGGPLPQSLTGALLAIADKLDTICGCFSVGLVPTGASDPYALRRQGIGIVQIMLAHHLDFSLQEAIDYGLRLFGHDDPQTAQSVYAFIRLRVANLLAEQGYAKDTIAAVVDVSIDPMPRVWKRVSALQALRGSADFEPLAVAFKRIVNILRKAEVDPAVRPERTLFEDDSESALLAAYETVRAGVEEKLGREAYEPALREIATLRAPVDLFFERVLVMADKPEVRRNRLALLRALAGLFEQIADFSKIAT
jgi:glycyl-tRNA synthetase beta chain